MLKGLVLSTPVRPLSALVFSALSSAGVVSGADATAANGAKASPAANNAPPTLTPATVVITPERYRNAQGRLFQAIPAAQSPARIAGGGPYIWNNQGATNRYVDLKCGWAWDHPGGDWIDAARVRQGSKPWFSFVADAVAGGTLSHAYNVNVTKALQAVQLENRWCAFLLRCDGAPRTVAATNQLKHVPPQIAVVYADGSAGKLYCLYSSGLSAGSSLSDSASAVLRMPLVLEFEKPGKAVRSATLSLTVAEHWSGGQPLVSGYLVDPPKNTAPLAQGLAAAHGLLDERLTSSPQIIGAHRYVDGAKLADFAVPGLFNISAEQNYDPAIFGTGNSDHAKLPHRGLGKWINVGSSFSLVNSSYTGEGFVPLAPGLGALRVAMEAAPGITDGANVGYEGTTASNAKIFLPERDFGVLKRIFVRYYLRLNSPYRTPFAKRYHVRRDASSAGWTDMAGKTGITPAHDTTYGGVSGGAGGGNGWQMRLAWADCDAEMGGPNENGIALGLHTYDFQDKNPLGHRYGSTDSAINTQFGQKGGLGGVFYPGYWYCIEMEVDLNSVSKSAPGFLPDGAVRVWIDGRLTFERTGMVMRTLPLNAAAPNPRFLRPVRELGHRDLWFNWFHGGTTRNTIDRVLFVTGLVWGRSYIGPMKLA